MHPYEAVRLLHACPICCARAIRPLWEDVDGIISATGRKQQIRDLIGYGCETQGASLLSYANRAVINGCHILYSLTRPIWHLVDRYGYENDLGCRQEIEGRKEWF